MAQNSMGAMGDMAKGFVTGAGGFDASGAYDHAMNPAANGSSFSFDAQTMNTVAAVNAARNFGGGVLPQGMGMMAGILPAALKIQEHKQMREVADKYYEKYIKDFNRKYGFSEDQIKELVGEFKDVTDEICRLIPDEKMREMYQKYIDSYPTMYLSMIPAEALQTKLAVKCVSENSVLRKKIEEMSTCVSSLVRNLTDLQISAGIPPIVNLMFESMPDPLTAMTDPMYHKYNDAIVTYHKLLQDEKPNNSGIARLDPTSAYNSRTPIATNAEFLRIEPVHYLTELAKLGRDVNVMEADGTTPKKDADGKKMVVTQAKIEDLALVMSNMQTQTGCQPFGDEWNHTGPEPAMNPAMCLGEKDRFQPGNPRNNAGRTNVYQAKRDQNGNAQWVQSGQIPALSAGGPQMVEHQPQPVQQSNQWAGMSHMPGVDPRPMGPQAYQQMPPVRSTTPAQFNQAYAGPDVPRTPSNSRASGKPRGSRDSKKSKAKPKQRRSSRSTAV